LTSIIQNKIFIYIIPLIIGLLTSYSLPPYSYFFINFFTFPILFFYLLSNHFKGKWVSFKIGWIFGFGYFVSNLYWVSNSLTFEEIFKPLIPFSLIIIPLFLGLFYGLVTVCCSFFNLKKNFSSILIFAFFFSLIEYLRSFIFGGFPWNLIAYSFTEYLQLIQILSLVGTYSFNLLCITFFLIPGLIFFNYKKKKKILFLLFSILLLFINFFYGSSIIKKNEEIDKTNLNFVIKIISPKVNIKRFFQNESPEEAIVNLIKLSKPNNLENTLFIYPEGVLSNIYLQDLKNFSYIFSENFSEKHKIILGISSYENSEIFNSLVVLDKDVNILAKYDKNKLVPFGEYLPFENFLSNFGLKKITHGYQSFSSKNERKVFIINNISFIPLICYEIIYSGNINKNKQDFNFIVNISEDGWFGDSVGPHQHFSHSIFRSIEEGKNLIRSANNGISAHIDATGKIISKLESTEKGFIQVKNFRKTKKTIFNSFGNKIFFYFLIFYISLIFFLKKKENK
jgi:apolipoprotein N-acyltransferase